ncbi:MAG: peptidylprolyl isomerase [Anaerolineae bacterium]
MGKRREKPTKELTKKQIAIRRRDRERQRWLLIGLGAVALLVLGLLAAGLYQEFVGKPSSPVAIVNGVPIRTDEYQKLWRYQHWNLQNYIARLESQKAQYQGQEGSEFLAQYIDQLIQEAQTQLLSLDTFVLQQAIDRELIRQGAAKEGIVVTPSEIQAEIEEQFGFVRNPPTPTPTPILTDTQALTETPTPTVPPMTLEEFQKAYQNYLEDLKQVAGLSETDYKKLVEAELLQRKLEAVLQARIPTTAEQVHARHILVNNEEMARLVLNRLKAGDDFAAVAKEFSQDTSTKDQGGDLGWFPRGRMVPEFEEAAFSLPVGEVSEPVKTQYGYHIIKVEERDPNRPLDQTALEEMRAQALDNWLAEQRAAAQIQRMLTPDKVPVTPAPRSIR